MNNLQSFHKAIAAVAPIDGVSGDKEIWFKPEATEEQRLAAQAIADSWVDGDEVPAE
jgi:selenocysteine lyase/cysteine desulfurase